MKDGKRSFGRDLEDGANAPRAAAGGPSIKVAIGAPPQSGLRVDTARIVTRGREGKQIRERPCRRDLEDGAEDPRSAPRGGPVEIAVCAQQEPLGFASGRFEGIQRCECSGRGNPEESTPGGSVEVAVVAQRQSAYWANRRG